MRLVTAIIASVLVAAACSGGPAPTSSASEQTASEQTLAPASSESDATSSAAAAQPTATTTSSTSAPAEAVLAELILINDGTSEEPRTITAGFDLDTDADGFAEVRYFGGSVTRLDVLTTAELTHLTDDLEPRPFECGWTRDVPGTESIRCPKTLCTRLSPPWPQLP